MKIIQKTIHIIAFFISLPLLADTVTEPVRTFSGHSGYVYSVAFSPDGRYALSGSFNVIKLWDVASGTDIRTFSTIWPGTSFSVAFSPDSRYALGHLQSLYMWDVASGAKFRHFGSTKVALSFAFSPDGNYVLSGHNDSTMILWDVVSGEKIRTFSGHSDNVSSVAFSPDGHYALSGSRDKTLKLWDVFSGDDIRTFSGHSLSVRSVAYSPNSRYALSGSRDKTLKLWDVFSGDELRTFSGHSDDVSSVAFSPDGRYILSGSDDNTLKLWNIASGAEIRTFSGHSDNVDSVTFSPDGRYALSGSWDKTLKLWETGLGSPTSANAAPTASFTLSTSKGKAPLSITLDASSSSDSDGTIVEYAWSISDGRTLVGPNKEITFESAGTYEITLTVKDNEGLTHSSHKTVTVEKVEIPNQSPVASFTLSPEGGEEPLNVSATSTSTDPDGTIISYVWSANGTPFSTEQAVAGSGVPAGTYEVVLTVTDDKGATDSAGKTLLVTQKPEPVEIIPGDVTPGHAIIVAGTHSKDSLHPYTRQYTERMYKFLKMRSYTDDKIHYLGVAALDVDKPVGHPDTQHHDYKLFDPTKELEAAFATVAASLQAGEQFVFYFHGHGRIDNISVDRDRIEATKLRDLLATLPAGSQQIIIFETCHGGSFLDDLKGVNNRVVVTSTDDKSLAFQVVNSSFSEEFIKMLEYGSSLRKAFDAGATMIASHPKWFSGQRPWLDDDYDGVFLHDGLNSETIYIGKLTVDAAPPPRITEVHPYMTLTEDEGVLWVKVAEKQEDIHKVQAVLINPNYQLGEYIGEGTSFNRIEIDMLYNPAQDRYEVLYDGFCQEPGLWTIRYEAQSMEGKWSEIKQGEVTAQNPCKQLSVEMLLNKSRYTQGEQILLNMKVGGNALVDLYVGLVYPAGYYVTIAYPFSFSVPETIKVHQADVKIEGSKTYLIMDFTVPSDFPKGTYQACGVLTHAGADPHDTANWLEIHCAGFEVN
jgi:WD40 repeat protein